MLRRATDIWDAYRKRIHEEFAHTCASLGSLPQAAHDAHKDMISKTTILALAYAGDGDSRGAVIACDGLVSSHYQKVIVNENKIDQLDIRSAMATCGYAAPSMQAARYLRALFRIAKLLDKQELSAKGKAQQVNDLVGRYFSYEDYFFLPIFVAYDLVRKRARLFDIWGGGGYRELNDCYANGCGGEAALRVLKEGWDKDLTRNEAVDLAVRAIHAAAHETHGANEPQYVFCVTQKGLAQIQRPLIQRKLDRVRKTCKRCREERQGGVV